MNDVRKIKDEIKERLDNKVVAELLIFLGIPITRDFKFQENKSYSISKNGYIKDFGSSGFAGDIFDFIMKEKNIQLPKAIKFVADCLGVKYE